MEISNTLLQQITKVYETQGINYETFVQFAEDYKKQLEEGKILTDRKVKFSPETVRQYKSAIEHFKSFQYVIDREFSINELNGAVLQVFERYLAEQGLTMNSVSLYISKVKAICNVLVEKGISYTPVRIKTPKDKVTKINLSMGELKKICNTELTNSETQVRDLFICQCFTGLRYAFLQKFLKNPEAYIKDNNEGRNYIDIVSDKNNEQSIIPLHTEVVKMLKKYNGKMPIISEQYLNKMLKVIGRKAGLTQIIPRRQVIAGEMKEELKLKWELFSSHLGRAFFITNLKQYLNDNSAIMIATGHKSEKQLLEYVRSSKLEKSKPLFDCEFFEKGLTD